jgi:hypothetical protein
MKFLRLLCLAIIASVAASPVSAATFNGSYSQNFDSMGTSGTAAPTDWKHISFNMTTSNTTWTDATGIPANGTNSVGSIAVSVTATTLTATTTPTANASNGYNAAAAASTTSDRVIATAGTSVTGSGVQVKLTNGLSTTISALSIAFDTVRYAAASSVNELPGFWVFISTNAGTTWTNVTPNPTIATVPNTAGTTSTTLTITGLSIAAGADFYIRWADDNASQSSPDQIIGLNNVVIAQPTPTVALTAPASGTTVLVTDTVNLAATATGNGGATISKVEFFANGTKIGEDTSSPYAFAWAGMAPGSYALTAVATDSNNLPATSAAVNIVVSTGPPTVALTAPAEGAAYGSNATVSLAADANGNGGATIAKVEFFAGATKIGEDTSSPYNFDWTGMALGAYALTAKATDNFGAATTSTAVNITVANAAPTVMLTVPDDAAVFDAPASIAMASNAADSDGTITKVEYYANATKIGEATVSPYSFFWNSAVTGSYAITARAFDNTGASTVSNTRNITVTNTDNVAPTVAITAPAAGVAYAGNIAITTNAADTDGIVAKVEFFNGATKIGETNAAPHNFTWNSVGLGTYVLTAKATDNDGAATTSESVTINVQAAPLSFTETFDSMGTAGTALPSGWSFYSLSGGHDTFTFSPPDTATFLPNANSTAILVGSRTSTAAANATLIVATGPTTQKSAQGYNLALSGSSSDRAAGSSPSGNAACEFQWSLTNTSGAAITAVNVGYDIRRFTTTTNNNTAYDSSPYKGIEELPGYWLFYSVDNGASWTNVAALNPSLTGSGVLVPNSVGVTTVPATMVPLSNSWGSGATLLLRWIDDNAESPSPDQIIGLDNVTVSAAAAQVGESPAVSITAPLAIDSFTAVANISLAADASDSDGTVSKVEFYSGVTKVGETTTAPFAYQWLNVPAGTYSLTARAIDNDGNTGFSTPVVITVNAAPGSGTLTRNAYLQQAGPTTMTLRWRSSQSIVGRVRYGSAPGSLSSSKNEGVATTEHEVTLTGLSPSTTYYYSVGSTSDVVEGGDSTHFFVTSPTAGTTQNTRIWALGDAGTGSANQTNVRDAFYTWTGSRDPNLVLELGDNAYNAGLDTEFQTAVFNIYGTLMRRVPFWSCLGNHETNQATAFVDTYPYFTVYTFPKAAECGGVASGTEHYFSWDYANIHFISLDSMTASRAANGAMATWLQNDLSSTTATWIIALFHHPPYTKGSHNSDSETELVQMRQNILPILEDGGVDLVLSGHSHCYERSYLLDGHYGTSTSITSAMKVNAGDGRPAGNGAYVKPLTGVRSHKGAVYAVAGSSGQTSGGSLNHPAHYISLNNLGSLVLDINGSTLNGTFLRETGVSNDTFTVIKQDPDTAAPVITTLPPDRTIAAGGAGTAAIPNLVPEVVATDNVGVTSITQSPTAGTVRSVGVQNVTITVKDAANNSATGVVHITIADQTPPSVSAPGGGFTPAALTTGANGTAALPSYVSQAVTSDNVGVASVTQMPAAGTALSPGTTTVTITAADSAGNSAQTTFNVAVADGTPPTIGGTFSPLTVATGAGGTVALANYVPQAVTSDNVAVTNVTQFPAAASALTVGTTHVTLTAFDAAGNSAGTSFDVIVTDGTPPTVAAPAQGFAPLTLATGTGGTVALPDYAAQAIASDEVGIASITQNPAAGAPQASAPRT